MKLFVVALLFACQLQNCRMQSCRNYALRLIGGQTNYEGRVEICVNGQWGTICDDLWGQTDANVVCRQLGYSSRNAVAHHAAHYGQGTGLIFLDNVQCTGTELMLINCSHPSVGTHNCHHSEDAGVRCQPTRVCVQGELRLIGGGNLEGRVEICLNEAWGTVCDDFWGTNDASVACKQLGYSRFNASAFSNARFGRGSGQIFLDDVQCTGSEGRLIDCRYDRNTGDCSHFEDASVRCQPKICSDGDVRLVGGSVSNEGRVEVCFNETWGTVCDDEWDTSDATVVCRQLGLSRRNATNFSQARFGVGSGPIYLDNVYCTGSELVLSDCPYDSHTADCTHHEDAGVRCNLHCQDGEIRLAGHGRATEREGRVEVCFNEEWGTVCDDSWDEHDARVVCRQLGYSQYNATAYGLATHGEGVGQIYLDDVRCNGSEERLVDCSHTSTHNCVHLEDASVRCSNKNCSNGDIRLVGGRFQFEGRVEVCWNETWGTVCDGLWSLNDAQVACRQLGFPNNAAVTTFMNAHFGRGTGPILLDDLVCMGNESRLVDCRHDGIGQFDSCTHADDAGVRCRQPNCTNGDLRLVGGLSQYEGRVEVCWNETWGTVCDDFWSFNDARVVCRQLGYLSQLGRVQAFHRAHFGEGSGPILLDNLFCNGSETRLVNCSRNTIGHHNCFHSEDAGVRCGQCVEGSTRLVGGSSSYEGRVEICLSGRWGTVCDDGWDNRDAKVVCRQLGYPTQNAQALHNASYGQGTTPIIMSIVQCGGSETRLASCTYQNATNLRSCSHSEDASVHCLQPAPRSIRIIAQSSTTLNISWAAPIRTNRYILRYNISCSGSGVSWSHQTADNTTFSTIVTGLHPYTQYSCCISAIISTAEGARACRISPRTLESAPTAAPQNVTGFATGSRSLSLYWSPPPSQHWNGRVRYYRVNITDVFTNVVRWFRAYRTRLTAFFLQPYSTYRCTVAAVTVAQGPQSAPITIQTYQDVPSGPPLDVAAVPSTPYSIMLSWSLPRSTYRNGIITGYTVRVTAASRTIFQGSTTATSYTVSSLSPYTRYNCSVAAKTVNGTGPYSRIVLAWTQEASPTGPPRHVSRSLLNSTTLHLSWQPPLIQHRNGVIREYRVNITEVESGRHFQNTTTTTSITIPFLHPYYNYLCSVAAYTVGIGPYSSTLRVQMPEDVPSGPPHNLHGAVIAADSVTLTWGLPLLEDQNGVITGYVVLVTSANSGQSYQVNSNTTNLNLTSLIPNSLYTFAVAAQNRRGRGPYSNSITLRTSTDVPTAPPQSFTVTVLGPRSLRLSWTPPPSNQQNGEILGYTVTVANVETGREEESNTTSTSYLASSLHPYYTYQCKVAAFTSIGLGPFSRVVSQRTRQASPSGFPQNFLAVATSPRSILLTWILPLPQDRNGIITGYFINATLVETGEMLQQSSNSTSLAMNARPYTTYLFIIAAVTVAGRGPFSTEISIKTPESAPSHHPVNITEQVLGPTSFRLSWSPPPVEHHHGVIRGYNVNVTEIETGRKLRYSTQSTAIVIRALHPFYLYNCTVTAFTVGEGPSSAIIGVRTEEAAPSAAPGNLQVTSISPYSLHLQWNPPPLEHRNGIIRRYNIVLSQLNSETTVQQSTLTNSITIRGLKAYTTYRCKVAAYTTALGPFSSEVQNRTHEDVPSGPPQGLTAAPTNARTLVLTWRAPAEEDRNGVIRGYTINVTGVLSGQTRQFETVEARLTVESLHPYYSYNCSVAARTIELGPFTYNVTAKMPEAAPSSAPQNVEATIISPTVARLSWDAPLQTDQNGIIRRYHINITEVDTARQWTLISVTNTYILNFLRPHHTYLYSIAAVTISTGPHTQLLNFTTPPDIPGTPTNFSVTYINSTALVLTWQPPPPEQRNGVITRYVINITGLSEARQEPYVLYTTKTNVVVGSLHPSYTYTCKVAAETNVGPGPFSITVAQLPEDIPSSPPQDLVVAAVSSTILRLTWAPPPRENQNGRIRGYRINVTELETGRAISFFSRTASRTIPNLHPAYNYTCVVAAITVGDGPGVTASIQLPEDVPSGPPQQFTAEIDSSTAVVLRWNPPLHAEQNGIIAHYAIRVALEGGDIFETVTQSTTYLNNTLRPYSTYNFSVAAATSVGTGPFSHVITVNTPEAAPRVAPNVGVSRRLSATSIQISWDPLSTVESLGVVTSYSVKYRVLERVTRRNLDDKSTIVETTNASIILSDLDPRYRYAVSVAAKTIAGIGNYSEEIIIGLFYNSPFQLHLSGAILCSDWLSYRSSETASSISKYIAEELMDICNCSFSDEYIADPDLICMENNTGGVIFQGRLISTEDMNSTEMISQLERWAQNKPIIVAKGVKLTVAGICSEHPRGHDCIMDNTHPTVMTPTQNSNPTGVGVTESHSIVPVIGAGAGGGVFLLIVAVVILIVVVLVVRRRRYKRRTHFGTQNPAYAVTSPPPHDMRLKIFEWEPQGTMASVQTDFSKEKQCKWDMGAKGEDDEHIYDTIQEPFSSSEGKKLDGVDPCSYCTPVKHFGDETANHSQLKGGASNYMKLRLENSQLETEADTYTSLHPGDSQLRPGDSQIRPGDSQLCPGDSQLCPGDSQLRPGDSQLRPDEANYSKSETETDNYTSLHPGDSQLEAEGASYSQLGPEGANYSQLGPEGANYSQLGPEDSQLETEADDYSKLRVESANHSQLGAEGANYSQLHTAGMLGLQYINVRRSTTIPNPYDFFPNTSSIEPTAFTGENVLESEQDEYMNMASPPSP